MNNTERIRELNDLARTAHDFGSFKHGENTVFWKIDYYDKHLVYGSEDPSDPAKTTRVLTIMLREEY